MKEYKIVRGFRDIYNQTAWKIHYITQICIQEGKKYGFQYIILPTVEYTDLFKRSMENSDLINKEIIDLTIKDGQHEMRSLRGEGTAQTMRSAINQGLTESRLMYEGSFFRDERKQKGRYKEFRQFGAEFTYARDSKYEELLMFKLLNDILQKLEIPYKIKINNIGTNIERKEYEKELKRYVENHVDAYSIDVQKKLQEDKILSILDSKNETDINANKNAPKIKDYVADQHILKNIIELFKINNIKYEIDEYLVRGLDYYNGIVFEITSDNYDTNSCHVSVGGGGRYDSLSNQLNGKNIKESFGFALGIDRLAECIEYNNDIQKPTLNVVVNDHSISKINEIHNKFNKQYIIKIFSSKKQINNANKNNKTIYID